MTGARSSGRMKTVLVAPSDAYLYHFRLPLAEALRTAGHEVVLVSPPGPYGPKLESLGFRWVPVPMARSGVNPVREAALVWRLFRLFRRERPDLVHGFIMKGALYGALAARLAGVPARVGSITGLGYLFLTETSAARMLRALVRGLFRVAFSGDGARVILQNRDDLALFGNVRLATLGTLVMIPGSGVDCERFRPRETEEAADAPAPAGQPRFRVLLAARLLWHKGLAEYVEAARMLCSEGRPVDFLLAGEPDPDNPTSVPESTVRAWAQQGWVQWLGYVEDMPGLLHTVDAVVLPSYREGLPKALVEGAACGLPLVATDVPGCREVVTDGVHGLLVPVRDAGALAAAVRRLQDDPALRRRLGTAARAKAVAEFGVAKVVQRTLDVYGELLPGFR